MKESNQSTDTKNAKTVKDFTPMTYKYVEKTDIAFLIEVINRMEKLRIAFLKNVGFQFLK